MPGAVFAGTPANPFFKGSGEDEGVFVADLVGDDFDFLIRLDEEFSGMLHPQIDDVVDGGAAHFPAAEAAQMLVAGVADGAEAVERPIFTQPCSDLLPEAAETVVHLPRAGKTCDVIVDDVDPMDEGGRRGAAFELVPDTQDSVPENQGR